MRKTAEKWIQKCELCQRMKPALRKEVTLLRIYVVGEPMEAKAIHAIG